MPKYYYKAKKGPVEIIEDVIEASGKDEAVEKISALGYLPIFIEDEALRKKASKQDAPVASPTPSIRNAKGGIILIRSNADESCPPSSMERTTS